MLSFTRNFLFTYKLLYIDFYLYVNLVLPRINFTSRF